MNFRDTPASGVLVEYDLGYVFGMGRCDGKTSVGMLFLTSLSLAFNVSQLLLGEEPNYELLGERFSIREEGKNKILIRPK